MNLTKFSRLIKTNKQITREKIQTEKQKNIKYEKREKETEKKKKLKAEIEIGETYCAFLFHRNLNLSIKNKRKS